MSRTSDKNQRKHAVPYQSQIMGYNHSENSDTNISLALVNPPTNGPTNDYSLSGLGDVYPLANSVAQTDYMIRFLRPKFGQIIQAYLNIQITFAQTEPNPKFRISVGGPYNADGVTAQTPNNTFITQCMGIINPGASYFQGQAGQAFTLYGLNIEPLIPQVGSINYIADSFSIGIHFITSPVMTGTFAFQKFFITGSVLLV